MVVALVLLVAFIYLKRRKSKKLEMMSTQYNDETRPLLNEGESFLNDKNIELTHTHYRCPSQTIIEFSCW